MVQKCHALRVKWVLLSGTLYTKIITLNISEDIDNQLLSLSKN